MHNKVYVDYAHVFVSDHAFGRFIQRVGSARWTAKQVRERLADKEYPPNETWVLLERDTVSKEHLYAVVHTEVRQSGQSRVILKTIMWASQNMTPANVRERKHVHVIP